MSRKTLALAAITALALSAHTHAQVLYNWTLNYVAQSGSKPNASGSGTLTLTGNEVTAMTGTMFGGSVTLIPAFGFYNDNLLPLTSDGLSFTIAGEASNLYQSGANTILSNSSFSGRATFNYTIAPVPEPSTWATGGVFGLAAVVTVAARRRQQVARA